MEGSKPCLRLRRSRFQSDNLLQISVTVPHLCHKSLHRTLLPLSHPSTPICLPSNHTNQPYCIPEIISESSVIFLFCFFFFFHLWNCLTFFSKIFLNIHTYISTLPHSLHVQTVPPELFL